MLFPKQIIREKINLFLFLVFVFALPFKDNYLPTILSLWIFSWLYEGRLKEKFLEFNYLSIYYIPFALFFLLTVIAILSAKKLDEGWYNIQEKLSLAFFPIILSGSNKQIKKNYQKILLIFVTANVIASIYLLGSAFIKNLIIENNSWYIKYWLWDESIGYSFWKLVNMRQSTFSYSHLSRYLHPAYLSSYIIFSLIILIWLYKQKLFTKITHKLLVIVTILFFAFMIYLLQSSAAFVTLIAVILFALLWEVKRVQKKRYIFFGSLVFILVIFAFLNSDKSKKRLNDYTSIFTSPASIDLNKIDDRMGIWYSTFQIIKENFWFGVGPANMYDELKKQYYKYGFDEAAKERLNAHNQYLETFAGLGIFGFLSLLGIIAGGFYYAFKNKHYLLFFLMLILSINFMFESMLNRIAGILFMMLFYSIFIFMNNNIESPPKSHK